MTRRVRLYTVQSRLVGGGPAAIVFLLVIAKRFGWQVAGLPSTQPLKLVDKIASHYVELRSLFQRKRQCRDRFITSARGLQGVSQHGHARGKDRSELILSSTPRLEIFQNENSLLLLFHTRCELRQGGCAELPDNKCTLEQNPNNNRPAWPSFHSEADRLPCAVR